MKEGDMTFLDTLARHQFELDNKINTKHGLDKYETSADKVTALLVELGELANETRCFKFWSNKPPSEKKVILEELIDVLHFTLSEGNLIGYGIKDSYQNHLMYINHYNMNVKDKQISKQFRELFKIASRMDEDDYVIEFLRGLMLLANMLGFTTADLKNGYMRKNQINHERQENGY